MANDPSILLLLSKTGELLLDMTRRSDSEADPSLVYEDLGFEIVETHPDATAAPVGKGGIVVFSSLTPHLTGPNVTDAVRKAYILQYAPDGAAVLVGDPASGAPTGRILADAPARQFDST